MRKIRPRVWIVVGVAVLIVAGGVGIVAWKVNSTPSAATPTERTVDVTAQTIKETVGTSGTVQPADRADLTFTSSGTVTSVKVGVGDKVTKGQKLATLATDSLEADVQAAQANYDAAKDDLATAEDATTTTDVELNAAKSKVAVQKSQLAQAKAALSAATLRSPINGTVAAVTISKGDSVGSPGGGSAGGTGNSSSSSNTAAVTVISTGEFVVDTSVGSADLAKLKKGLQAEITTTGATTPIYGTVASVAVMASTSSGTSTTNSGSSASFAVTIAVTGAQKTLYAGASATVSIIVKQRTDVLVVPTAAISTTNGKTTVTKVVDGKHVVSEITVGETYGTYTEVTKGLASGDQVIVTFIQRVPTGNGSGGTGSGRYGNGGGFGTGGGGFPGGGTGGGQGGGTR